MLSRIDVEILTALKDLGGRAGFNALQHKISAVRQRTYEKYPNENLLHKINSTTLSDHLKKLINLELLHKDKETRQYYLNPEDKYFNETYVLGSVIVSLAELLSLVFVPSYSIFYGLPAILPKMTNEYLKKIQSKLLEASDYLDRYLALQPNYITSQARAKT